MRDVRPTLAYTLVAATLVAQSLGCRSIERFQYAAPTPPAPRDSPAEVATADFEQATDVAPSATEIVPAMAEAIPLEEITQPELIAPGNSIDPPEEVPAPPPTINQVIASVRMHFPLIEQAAAGRVIASGQASRRQERLTASWIYSASRSPWGSTKTIATALR